MESLTEPGLCFPQASPSLALLLQRFDLPNVTLEAEDVSRPNLVGLQAVPARVNQRLAQKMRQMKAGETLPFAISLEYSVRPPNLAGICYKEGSRLLALLGLLFQRVDLPS